METVHEFTGYYSHALKDSVEEEDTTDIIKKDEKFICKMQLSNTTVATKLLTI